MDVLQAGTSTLVSCWDGVGTPPISKSNFWILWSGTEAIPLTKRHPVDLPVKAGDKVSVRIVAATTGPDQWETATVYFKNQSTGMEITTSFHSGCIHCGQGVPEDARLYGSTAEWVAEIEFTSPSDGPETNTLDNFGVVEMSNISVTDSDGNIYTPLNPGNATANLNWMSVNGRAAGPAGDTLLACANVSPGDDGVVISRAPYQLVAPAQIGDLEPKPINCDGTIQPPPP
jgi:hypothetical protein